MRVGEVQLLGPPNPAGVWGRLLVARPAPDEPPVLFCRTGTYVDTVEQGGRLRAFAPDEGTPLWQHADTAPAQYREKYWRAGDVNADGLNELVTYADDMKIRIFTAAGRLLQEIDLRAWEDARRGKPGGLIYYGGKSMALWPRRESGRPDLYLFGHVHHYRISLDSIPAITRRDRKPTIECAPAASLAVVGWSGTGKQNLVGVAPWAVGVILWEDAGPDKPPRLVRQRAFGKPLVQPSANNQQPVFVECLRVERPDGILAATPRGVQFFAKPDLRPGWVFAGMCPTSAAVVVPGNGDAPDRILVGRENGRVLLLDAASGKLMARTLLDGAVRRIALTPAGDIVVGTNAGLFLLDTGLRRRGRHALALEDLAVCETATGTVVCALSNAGELVGFRIAPERRGP
jgi:hypothetical protein